MYVHRNDEFLIVLISWVPLEGLAEEYLEENDSELLEFKQRG